MNDLKLAMEILHANSNVFEIRVPKAGKLGTISGYFNDIDTAVSECQKICNSGYPGIYITLNPVNPVLLSRSSNRLKDHAESTTSDVDIQMRQWLLIDIDATRPSGISSSDEEHDAAFILMNGISDFLSEFGWPSPILADSGNGAHLLYRIDLPNDDESRDLIKTVLNNLSVIFDDDRLKVDKSVFNAARISKLYGTMACKGDDTLDRPHRQSRLLEVPGFIEIVPIDKLQTIASLSSELPVSTNELQTIANKNSINWGSYDLETLLISHGLSISKKKDLPNAILLELDECPFNPEHRKSSFVILFNNGAVTFKCHHNSCQSNGWRELKEILQISSKSVEIESIEPWREPSSLTKKSLPTFPIDSLPERLQNFVTKLSISLQVPIDLPGVIALGVVATAIQGKVTVHPKIDWSEPTCIFILVIAPPAERKSAALAALRKPLDVWVDRESNNVRDKVKAQQAEARALKKRVEKLELEYAKNPSPSILEALQEASRKAESYQVDVMPRLTTSDVTPEKLANLMYEHKGRMTIMSAEAGTFDDMAGRYSQSENLDVYLSGHSSEMLQTDRMGRPSDIISNPTLTICLCGQPSVLDKIKKNPSFRDRGLLARFLFSIPDPMAGRRMTDPPSLDEDTQMLYQNLVIALLADSRDRELTLDETAAAYLRNFSDQLEPKLAQNGDYSSFGDWAGKSAGAACRLAGILHCADYNFSNKIDGRTMANAIKLIEYFTSHAEFVLSSYGGSDVKVLEEVLDLIRKKKMKSLKARDLMRAFPSKYQKAEQATEILDLLEEAGYLRMSSSKSRRGRPSNYYDVNPAVFLKK